MSSASDFLSQINKILKNLADLNSNVKLYRQIRSLEEDLNALEKKYEESIKTSTCNAQCKKLNETIEPNSVEDFLVQLLLSKSKYNPLQDVGGFDKPFFIVNAPNAPQASAPPASEPPASAPPASELQASASP